MTEYFIIEKISITRTGLFLSRLNESGKMWFGYEVDAIKFHDIQSAQCIADLVLGDLGIEYLIVDNEYETEECIGEYNV